MLNQHFGGPGHLLEDRSQPCFELVSVVEAQCNKEFARCCSEKIISRPCKQLSCIDIIYRHFVEVVKTSSSPSYAKQHWNMSSDRENRIRNRPDRRARLCRIDERRKGIVVWTIAVQPFFVSNSKSSHIEARMRLKSVSVERRKPDVELLEMWEV